MITLRSLTSKVPKKISTYFQPYVQSRSSLLPPSSISSLLQTLPFSTESGIVKFYNIKKAYGFIIADSDQKDLFVHRRNIRGAPEDDNMNPILKKGERVMFKRIDAMGEDIDGEKIYADDVVFEDGDRVPVFRDDHLEKFNVKVKGKFGEKVYAILAEGGDRQEEKIAEAFAEAKETIERLETKFHREKQQN